MTTERKSLLAIVLGRLMQDAVPVDGIHIWEPSGALKFTTQKPAVPQEARCEVTDKAPRAQATANSRLCVQ
jgi:hypothetical protein